MASATRTLGADSCFDRGLHLLGAGRLVDAADAFLACVRASPSYGPGLVNLADTLRRLTLLAEAHQMAELGVRHLPASAEARACLANVLHDRGEYEQAVAQYEQAIDIAPTYGSALTSLGNSLRTLGRLTEAMRAHDRAVATAPDDADFHFNRAITRLAAGDFIDGWAEYEWRWRRARIEPRPFGPAWRGEALAGRTILLHAEQGLGDTLQFVRYAPLVEGRVVMEVQRPLVRLCRAMPGVDQVVAEGDELPAFDTHCPLMSLPLAFATTLETVPGRAQYLAATLPRPLPERRGKEHLRVGLVWAGSPHTDDAGAHLIDRRRSIPLSALLPLGEIPGVKLVSLQRDFSEPPTLGPPLHDPMPRVRDFADTAAIVAQLDLVISVDTSVAHLAGAMGKQVWLLSRYDGCWRWLHGRDDSPWYPTMTIYRQGTPHDWSDVIARVRRDLAAYSPR